MDNYFLSISVAIETWPQNMPIPSMPRQFYDRLGRILVMWLECRFLDRDVNGSKVSSNSMLCPLAGQFIRIASVNLAVK